jgi:hypothetical protein
MADMPTNDVANEDLEAARTRGEELTRGPRAESVRFDATRNRLIVALTTGGQVEFSPHDAQGLEHATAADLRAAEIDDFGLAIRFPTIDADFYVSSLIEGRMGSKNWMARRAARGGV